MSDMEPAWLAEFGTQAMVVEPAVRRRLSRDYFNYSPVLTALLEQKIADGVVIPNTADELFDVMAKAVELKVNITPRGAGTGNYGQAVPLAGGIVVDFSGLNRIVEIGDGYARVEAGVRLGSLEQAARRVGQEIRIYPSTFVKATVGGFVSGGSGGVGSITWGSLWDGNVLGVKVLTAQSAPRWLDISGADLAHYIHAYGTTGLVAEVTVPLAPKTDWHQLMISFGTADSAIMFGRDLADDADIQKRLISVHEWPIPRYFVSLPAVEAGCSVALLEVASHSVGRVLDRARKVEGTVVLHWDQSRYHRGIGVSDFTWNHTTLWARKADPEWTYLQLRYDSQRFMDQIHRFRDTYPEELVQHYEWIRDGGEVALSGLPLLRYTTEARLREIIAFSEEIGVQVFDPHTYELRGGGRKAHLMRALGRVKQVNDPYGILNPGKLVNV